jgi:hypothetical protein
MTVGIHANLRFTLTSMLAVIYKNTDISETCLLWQLRIFP